MALDCSATHGSVTYPYGVSVLHCTSGKSGKLRRKMAYVAAYHAFGHRLLDTAIH